MKSKFLHAFLPLIFLFACKKEELPNSPKVNTLNASNILLDKVTLNGEVIDQGTTVVNERGFVYSDKNPTPTISDNKIIVSGANGSFSILLANLNVNTLYYYRSYAINNQGISYGNILNFTTANYKLPTIITIAPQNIASISATLLGSISDDGGAGISERGFYLTEYSGASVKSTIMIQAGNGMGDFSKSISTLVPNTKYSFKAYAKNITGIIYGSELVFNTLPEPALTTVISNTGRIWLDRNLGASSVATSITDSRAFGYLYQWGRKSDGHQLKDSQLTSTLSSSASSTGSAFILSPSNNGDWLVSQDDNLWNVSTGINNVCPTGFRLPTKEEWITEIASWNSKGGFDSPLKLPLAGYRGSIKGEITDEGNSAFYWSSTPSTFGKTAYGIGFTINDQNGAVGFTVRAKGASVRCIKN